MSNLKEYIATTKAYKKDYENGLVRHNIAPEINKILNELNLFYILIDALQLYIETLINEKLSGYKDHGKVWFSRSNARHVSFDAVYVYFGPSETELNSFKYLSAPIIEIKLQSKKFYIRKKDDVPEYMKTIAIPMIKDILLKMGFIKSNKCLCGACNK